MYGIKTPQQDFALKMQGGLMREGGGGAYLRDTTVYKSQFDSLVWSSLAPITLLSTTLLCTQLTNTKHICVSGGKMAQDVGMV